MTTCVWVGHGGTLILIFAVFSPPTHKKSIFFVMTCSTVLTSKLEKGGGGEVLDQIKEILCLTLVYLTPGYNCC